MKLIGLAGPAGVGKDTIADHLVEAYGFQKFSFADALYKEVAEGFGVGVEFLQDRGNKEKSQKLLQYCYCRDREFQKIMEREAREAGERYPHDPWCSPRQILQWWGTEYRRAQDPEYWIKRADEFVRKWLALDVLGEPRMGLVQTSVRFPNERAFIEKWNGEVWHVRRPDWEQVAGDGAKHVAEAGLPILPQDKTVHNSGTIERLRTTAMLMLAAEPGAVYHCNEHPAIEAVQCGACGYLHRALSRAEVQAEVDAMVDWRTRQTAHVQARLATYPSLVETYEGCICCGSMQFKPADPKLLGPMTPPVIYEPDSFIDEQGRDRFGQPHYGH